MIHTTINLPPSDASGFYSATDLPELIADALHPDAETAAEAVRAESLASTSPTPENVAALEGLRAYTLHESGAAFLLAWVVTKRGYRDQLIGDAKRPETDPKRINVLSKITRTTIPILGANFPPGSVVHASELQRWGAANGIEFRVGESAPQESEHRGAVETPKQRRHRWLTEFEEVGQLQRVYETEKRRNPSADRSYIGKQIKKAQAERDQERQSASAPPKKAARKAAHPFDILGIGSDKAAE